MEGEVTGPTGKPAQVTFLVDSGAGYCLLPDDVWKSIELVPSRCQTFVLADGTRMDRKISECRLKLEDREASVTVILGEPGDEPLLGMIALENLGFMIDPFKRKLLPMEFRVRGV